MINPKTIRQVSVLLVILFFGILIFREMIAYLSGVLGAITIYVLFRKYMIMLTRKGWHPSVAALLLMFISFLIIIIPIALAIMMLASKIGNALNNSTEIISDLQETMVSLGQRLGYDVVSFVDAEAISGWLSENVKSFASGTFETLIALTIMYFMLYYMFTNRKELRESLYEYIPMNRDNLKKLGLETRAMVRSNAIGIPLVAIAQGVVACIGFLIFKVDNPYFWAVMVAIGSMIPFVGNFLGTIPVFIISLNSGDSFQAYGVLIYGLVVVGSTDNIIRLYVLNKLDDVHPLITLLGVIIGIPLFGFIGLIFGPLLISLFLIIVKIYKNEYGHLDKNVL